MALRAWVPRTATDPTGEAFRGELASAAGVDAASVAVIVEERTTIVVEGCDADSAERASLLWARQHLPELEFAFFCGDVRIQVR